MKTIKPRIKAAVLKTTRVIIYLFATPIIATAKKIIQICLCAFLLLGTSTAADNQDYSSAMIGKLLKELQNKIKRGEGLSPVEREAIRMLEKARKEARRSKKKNTMEGMDSSESNVFCLQKFQDNEDDTFTYKRTTEEYYEEWIFTKNANPLYWGDNWHNAAKRVKEEGDQYQLPPSEVLLEIAKLANVCATEVQSVAEMDLVSNAVSHFQYWTSDEYSYINSPYATHAFAVSLYYVKTLKINKSNIGIIWPCYLNKKTKHKKNFAP